MIGRIATFAQLSFLVSGSMAVQTKMAEAQAQESSGLIASTYGGLGDKTSSLLRVNSQLSQLTADKTNVATASSFANEVYSSLGDISDLATKIQTQLSAYMSGSSTDQSEIQNFASNMLSQLTGMLNATFGGRYLYSGTSTNIEPVNLSAPEYDPSSDPDIASTSYYQGSSNALSFISSNGDATTLSVQADAPAFEQMLRGLSVLEANPGSSNALNNAYDLIGGAITQIGTMRESVSANASALSTLQSQSDNKIGLLQDFITSVKNSDISQTTVEVTQDQTQLEALYSTISSWLKTSLVDYLR